MTPQQPEPFAGESSGRALGSEYRLVRMLGQGAMGQVWLAVGREGQQYAAKLLHPHLVTDARVRRYFVVESSIVTEVVDPHLVRVLDMVAERGTLAVVMEFVDGPDLRHHLDQRGTLSQHEALVLVGQVASGLAALHARGIVHRDVKPENVLLATLPGSNEPLAKLTDFGVAYVRDAARPHDTQAVGTPYYMAPELIDGHAPTPSCDLYALGMVLYQLVCGVTPFAGRTPAQVYVAQVQELPGRPPGLVDPVWDLVKDLVAKDPARRPATAAAVARRAAQIAPLTVGIPAVAPLTVPPTSGPVNRHDTIVPDAPGPSGDETTLAPPVAPPPRAESNRAESNRAERSEPTASHQPVVATGHRRPVVPVVVGMALAALLAGGGVWWHERSRPSTGLGGAASDTTTSAPPRQSSLGTPTAPATARASGGRTPPASAASRVASPTAAQPSASAVVTVTVPAPAPTATTVNAAASQYHNARFGFTTSVPRGWVQGPSAPNGDGAVFTSADGASTLTVSGHNTTVCSGARQCQAQEAAARRAAGSTVTYQSTVTRNWFVVSGLTPQGLIYYERVWVGSGSTNSAMFVYPSDQQSNVGPLITSTMKAFDPGDLSASH